MSPILGFVPANHRDGICGVSVTDAVCAAFLYLWADRCSFLRPYILWEERCPFLCPRFLVIIQDVKLRKEVFSGVYYESGVMTPATNIVNTPITHQFAIALNKHIPQKKKNM